MSTYQFDNLLCCIKPIILHHKKHSMPVDVTKSLVLTLRILAPGESNQAVAASYKKVFFKQPKVFCFPVLLKYMQNCLSYRTILQSLRERVKPEHNALLVKCTLCEVDPYVYAKVMCELLKWVKQFEREGRESKNQIWFSVTSLRIYPREGASGLGVTILLLTLKRTFRHTST